MNGPDDVYVERKGWIERGGKGRNEERRSAYAAGWPPIRDGGLTRPSVWGHVLGRLDYRNCGALACGCPLTHRETS